MSDFHAHENPALDARGFAHAISFQESQNGRYAPRLTLHRDPPYQGEESGTTAFHFTVRYLRRGACLHSLTLMLAALEAHCAPVEEVQFTYHDGGGVTATVFVGVGWHMPEGMHDFLALAVTTPRFAAFAWSLDVLPHYTHIAARAVERPERYEAIGAFVRAALDASAPWLLPEVLCPCDVWGVDNNTQKQRVQTAGILQRLRDGLLRWRSGGRA